MANGVVIVAGATGNLGLRVARNVVEQGGRVRALVRASSDAAAIANLHAIGAETAVVDYDNVDSIAKACANGDCVVSALSGLRDVIVETQSRLLRGALAARIPRFIPSDYSVDFTRLPNGSNRNFDLRREFHQRLAQTPIRATSIFNGMFTDLLVGPPPIVLFKLKRVMYWENAHQILEFTTIDDTANFTASAALEEMTPRFLYIAGDRITAHGIAEAASEVTSDQFKLLRAGGVKRLAFIIKVMRRLMPAEDEVFPPWQGMQYPHNMFEGSAMLGPLDNDRYGMREWTTVKDVLASRYHHP